MKLLKHTALTVLFHTLIQLKQAPLLLVIASFVDALFFVAYGFFTTPFSDQIVAHSVLITNQLGPILSQGKQGILPALLQNPLRPLTGKLLMLLALLFIVTYLVYTVFQATSWYFCHHIARKKASYKHYVLSFAKLNILWIALYILYKLLDTITSMRYILIKKFAPATPNIAGNILLALFLITCIAAIFSYATLNAKTLFRTPLRKTLPVLLVCAILFLNAQFIINAIAQLNTDAGILFGIIILFPLITLLKTYLVNTLDHA